VNYALHYTNPPDVKPILDPGIKAIHEALSGADGGNIMYLALTIEINIEKARGEAAGDCRLEDAFFWLKVLIPGIRAIQHNIEKPAEVIDEFVTSTEYLNGQK
jgi:hypothetical protein